MELYTIVAIISLVISIATTVYTLFFMPEESVDLDPTLSPTITMANEGAIIPVLFGEAKFPGNIVGYAHFAALPRYESDQKVGYYYFLDVWQAICMGQITILNLYVKDKDENPLSLWNVFNDGTGSTHPANQLGTYANSMPGVAWYFWKRLSLGSGTTFIPTIHFVAKRVMPAIPVSYSQLTNGWNPATIIYNLLIENGCPSSKIDLTKFNEAATYWNSMDYGLNILLSKQAKLKDIIKQVLSYVGGVFGKDAQGKYFIRALNPADASVATISSENDDFIEFEFIRKTWDDTYNEFHGAFTDKTQDYSTRQLVVRNRANINLQGRIRSLNVDLKAFISKTDASKRLWEIMKKESYPYAKCSFKTNLSFSSVNVGDVVTIINLDYGIVSADFRILEKQYYDNTKNELSFQGEQVTETLFDDKFLIAGTSQYSSILYVPSALVKQRIFELPYNSTYKHEAAFLMLAARVGTFENGWNALVSFDNIDYDNYGEFGSWSINGTLDAAYPVDTDYIDDIVGISFTPYQEDLEFSSVGRAALFATNRYALIDNEIMRFQNIELVEGSYQLTGIIRGCFNTAKAVHTISSEIWIFTLGNNVLTGINSSDFYIKMTPVFMSKAVDEASATAIHVTPTGYAKIPFAPCRIEAVRSGSSITVTWWPTNQDIEGAGAYSADAQFDQSPSAYDQDFEIYETYATTPVVVAGVSTVITRANQTTIYVRSRRDGYVSAYVSVLVPAADGTYVGPDI